MLQLRLWLIIFCVICCTHSFGKSATGSQSQRSQQSSRQTPSVASSRKMPLTRSVVVGKDENFKLLLGTPEASVYKAISAQLRNSDTNALIFDTMMNETTFQQFSSPACLRLRTFIRLRMQEMHSGSLDDAMMFYVEQGSIQSTELAVQFGANPINKLKELFQLYRDSTLTGGAREDQQQQPPPVRLYELVRMALNCEHRSPFPEIQLAERTLDANRQFAKHCAVQAAQSGLIELAYQWAKLERSGNDRIEQELCAYFSDEQAESREQCVAEETRKLKRRLDRHFLLQTAQDKHWDVVNCITPNYGWRSTDALDQQVFEEALKQRMRRQALDMIQFFKMRLGDGSANDPPDKQVARQERFLSLVRMLTDDLLVALERLQQQQQQQHLEQSDVTSKSLAAQLSDDPYALFGPFAKRLKEHQLLEAVVRTAVYPEQVERVYLQLLRQQQPPHQQKTRQAIAKHLFELLWATPRFRVDICISISLAAETNQLQMVEYYVEKLTTISTSLNKQQRPQRERKSLNSRCPRLIMHAVRSGSLEMVEYFIGKGAYVNYPTDEPAENALFISVQNNYHVILYYLLQHDPRLPRTVDYRIWLPFWVKVNTYFINNVQSLRNIDTDFTFIYYLIDQNDREAVKAILDRINVIAKGGAGAVAAFSSSPSRQVVANNPISAQMSAKTADDDDDKSPEKFKSETLNQAFEFACVSARFSMLSILRSFRTADLSPQCLETLIKGRYAEIATIIRSDDEAARVFLEAMRHGYAPNDVESIAKLRRFRLDMGEQRKDLVVKILQNKSMLRIVLQRPEVSSTWLLSFVLDNWHLINGGHWEIIEWLLAANADPNGLDKGMFIKVLERGFTEPLHKLRLRWVEMFIEHGANVNYGDCIPLMMAVRENDLEMVQLLVRYGAKHVGEVLQVIHNRRGYAEIRSFFKQLIINRVGWWNYMTGNYDIHD